MDVDHDLAGQVARHLGDAIGAGGVGVTRHARHAAERLDRGGDPRIIGGHHNGADGARGDGPTADVLDHRPAVEVGERLTGKACGGVTGGDESDHTCRL